MKYGFGVDLGGTTVKIAFFDQEGTLLHKWEIPTDTSDQGSRILPDIAASILDYIRKQNIPQSDLLGIGIGVPGPVDNEGTVNKCINLGWGVLNVPRILGELTGLPVKAGNDANVAALGEAWKGGGSGCENMVLATFGTGVGGGIVIGGKIVHGVHGAGGEIGHITLEPEETTPCGCGNYGCTEQYCSATGIVRIAKQFLSSSEESSCLRGIDPLTCKDIFDAAAANDPLAQTILDRVYRYMGQFLAIIACTVDPEIIVLGGGVSKAGVPMLEGARKYFDRFVFHAARPVRFALASLGNDAGAYGAFKMVLSEFEN